MRPDQRLKAILDLLLLAVLFWIVRYWHSAQFGLYEDDLTIIPDAFARSFSSLAAYVITYIRQMQGHARPLSDSLIYIFSWSGWRIAGLWGPYLIGYLITTINIGLFYWLVRRAANRSYALLAGVAYVLYSADTTQAFLSLSLGFQPSVTLILLAMHAYLSNKRILGYVLAMVVLFSYELPFVLLAAVPLLKKPWNRAWLKGAFWHTGILLLMLAAVYAFRASIGEGRVSNLGLADMLTIPLSHMLQGPFVSLGTFAYRPLQAVQGIDFEMVLVVLLAFAGFALVLSRLPAVLPIEAQKLWQALRDPAARQALPEEVRQVGRMCMAGAAMLVLAYSLTFTVRAYAISGRDTRVHAAGAAGAAILVAGAAMLLIHLAQERRLWRCLVRAAVTLEFALMAGYGFVIQRDYVNAWQYQRQFWTELLPLIPDAGVGTVILVDPAALHDTRQIGANYWNLPRVLYQLYDFPSGISGPPMTHRLEWGWQSSLVGDDGLVQINAATVYSVPGYYGEYDPRSVILIQAENGRLIRAERIVIDGQEYALKPLAGPVLPDLPHGFLYELMIVRP